MEVGLEGLTHSTHRRNIARKGLTVDDVLLREDVDNLLAGLEHRVVLFRDKAVDILLFYQAVF